MDGGYAISGSKTFCSGAGNSDAYLVAARSAEDPSLVSQFLVPAGTPGLKVDQTWDSLGMRATSSHDLHINVTVPAGKFPDTVRIEARMMLRITLSADNHAVVGTDVMNAWFAKGVGMVKYIERQELPPLRRDRGMVSEIQEELVEYKVKAPVHSFERRESPPQCILAHDARRHELQ